VFASFFIFFSYLTYLLPSRIRPLCFQAGRRRRRPNLVFSLLCLFSVSGIFMFLLHCWLCYYWFSYCVSLDFVFCISWFFTFFSVLGRRLPEKSIPEMTYFASNETLSINSIDQSATVTQHTSHWWVKKDIRLQLLFVCSEKVSLHKLAWLKPLAVE